MATTRMTATAPAADPLAKPDGQFVLTDALRADVAGYQRSRYAEGYGALVGADSLGKLLHACDPPSLHELSAMIRHSLSSYDFDQETVRKGYYPDLRKLLPIWMAYRHDGVLDILIRYPDDPFLLKYTEQWVLRWPVYGVQRILATRAPSRSPLMSLITRLLQQHPDWIEPLKAQGDLPEWLATGLQSTAAPAAVAAAAAAGDDGRTSDGHAHATAGAAPDQPHDLPELLRHPPWQRSKKPSAKDKLDQPWLKLPSRLPSLPAFVAPGRLTPARLRESGQALPPPALEALLTMFMLSKPGAPYAGLAQVLPALDRAALATMGRDLHQQWADAACPNEQRWILLAQAWTADTGAMRSLIDDIAWWPGMGAFPRAKLGLSVLADMAAFQRSDEPLRALMRFAEKGKPSLRKPALEQLRKAAERMGMTPDELGDRLIPDLGLTSPADLVFDFGPRRFTLRFDDALQPIVGDEQGRRLPDLPKPNAKDDAERAKSQTQRWKALKKQARVLAAEQTTRLEQALMSQRVWSAAEFARLYQRHPLLRELGRRFLWCTTGTTGTTGTTETTGTTGTTGTTAEPARTFRLSEEYSALDMHDAPVALGDNVSIRLVHPMNLDAAELAAWEQLWADYELMQPFEQLGRRVYRLDDDTPATRNDVPSVRGQPVAAGSLLGLVTRGWTKLQDGASVFGFRCACAGGGEATLDLGDAMDVSAPLATPVLTIARLTIGAQVTALDCSEVLRTVDRLARS